MQKNWASMYHLIFIAIGSFSHAASGQMSINETTFKGSMTNNCYSYEYNLKIPVLQIYSPEDWDWMMSIQRQINEIPESIIEEITLPEYVDVEDCLDMHYPPQEHLVDYTIFRTEKNLLSFVVSYNVVEGNGGHGGAIYKYCFNLDLENEQSIDFHELFDESRQQKVLELLKAEFNRTQNSTFESYTDDYLQLEGISIAKNGMIFHYLAYNGHATYVPIQIELTKNQIADLLVNEYKWLFN